MSQRNSRPRLTPQRSFPEMETTLEECPNCGNQRIGRTPRRKGGPSLFHCRRCSFMTSIDQMYDMYRLLGQVPA